MVSFRKFAVFVIMCCLTGSTSSSILEYSIKPEESTQKGSGEGSAADDTNDVPATGNLANYFSESALAMIQARALVPVSNPIRVLHELMWSLSIMSNFKRNIRLRCNDT